MKLAFENNFVQRERVDIAADEHESSGSRTARGSEPRLAKCNDCLRGGHSRSYG